MALKICRNSDKTGEITDASPLTTTHNGTTGEAIATKIFIYNDNAAYRYESVTVAVEDTVATTNEASWVALAPDNAGSAGTYGAGGASLSMANIADTTVKPFWVRVTVPASTPTQNKTDLRLKVTATEFAV